MLSSLEAILCSVAVAGGEVLLISGGCLGGSEIFCTALTETEHGGNGGGTGRDGRAGPGIDVDDEDAVVGFEPGRS